MKQNQAPGPVAITTVLAITIFFMVFLSGFAGLVYQVLWIKQLGLLFGNTSHAAAATLAAFFAGLALGSWFWGNRISRIRQPLRTYALLEVGIAVTAILYFVIIGLFHSIYPHIYQSVGAGFLLYLCKFVLALALIFPPAFCMGGTIPVIGHFMIRKKAQFGIAAARLYGVNTLGAALGAFLTGFYFIFLFGFNRTCSGAIGISTTIALIAFLLSLRPVGQLTAAPTKQDPEKSEIFNVCAGKSVKKGGKKRKRKNKKNTDKPKVVLADRRLITTVAFLSGFGILALEVLWTRIFAQLHENSVYSFSSVLVVVLISLALGALIAARLARTRRSPVQILAVLTVVGGIAVAFSPSLIMLVTNDLETLTTRISFFKYVTIVYAKGFAIIGIPCLLLGMIFPFLMKSEEHFAENPGKSLGRLAAVNTVGAILGSLLCGFAFLSVFGMWRTMQILGGLYLILGIVLSIKAQRANVFLKFAAGITLLLSFTILSPVGLPVVSHDQNTQDERILQVWETSDCTVTVTEPREGIRRIKVNSAYSLGSTSAISQQANQTKVPLMIYPDTRSIFYLGLGTGITAGAALEPYFNVERVVACELAPKVVEAAREYIAKPYDFTNGLFTSDKVDVVVEDGRHYLMATDETFDVVNADLFLPYRNGAGSLYSQEHFESVKARLNPGGVFVQWMPMFQVTEKEFGIVARTMLTVFDQVTLWRNNFQPGEETLALVGHRDKEPFPGVNRSATLLKQMYVKNKTQHDLVNLELPMDDLTIMLFYCGNITKASHLFENYTINTDDRPVIEYLTPRSLRETSDDGIPFILVALKLVKLLEKIQEACPPETDPMLANRTEENRRLPRAGLALHRVWTSYPRGGNYPFGDAVACKKAWDQFVREWTNQGENLRAPVQ